MKVMKLEEPRALEHAIATLQHGGTVAFPTDTVYGIGAAINAPEALVRIYEREGSRFVAAAAGAAFLTVGHFRRLSGHRSTPPQTCHEFWPGALTVAVPALPKLPPQIVAADGTVGVRVPDHSIALTLAQRSGGAIAVTSANLSGFPPPAAQKRSSPNLPNGLDLVLDGGIARLGMASTVVSLDGDTITIIREGAIAARPSTGLDRILDPTQPGIRLPRQGRLDEAVT